MSNAPTKPRSCTGRLFGTLFALLMAAAVVYVGSYLIIFQVTGVPVRGESGWLGAPMRYLNSAPFVESGDIYYYKGDTAPYRVFQPLNTIWLKTKDLPENPVTPPAAEASSDGSGEGRGGRGRRQDNETTGTLEATTEAASDGATTGGEIESSGESPRRRGRRMDDGAAPDGERRRSSQFGRTGQAEGESTGTSEESPVGRRRFGQRRADSATTETAQ